MSAGSTVLFVGFDVTSLATIRTLSGCSSRFLNGSCWSRGWRTLVIGFVCGLRHQCAFLLFFTGMAALPISFETSKLSLDPIKELVLSRSTARAR